MNHYIFVRHGQSVANAKKVIAGVSDVPLTKDGVAQAKQVAKELKDYKIDVAYYSSLLRAKQTMNIIAKTIKGLTVVSADQLKERNYGKFEGVPYDNMNQDPQGLLFWDVVQNVQVQNAETVKEYYEKVQNFFNNLSKKHQNQTILVVAHGGVFRVIQHMLNPKENDLLKHNIPNTKLIEFDL